MKKKQYKALLQEEAFTAEDIRNAAIIMHPGAKGYNLKAEEISQLFEEGSNFTQLVQPIEDEFGNEFRDSEGYYMAQRTDDLEIKKMISFLSIGYGLAKKSTQLYSLEQDEIKRIVYMKKAIQHKFDQNPALREKLLNTGDKHIIEYTYRKDTFFGIDQETLKGKNILGKLLMEYRDNHK